jgi:hypothetical protein
MDATAVLLRRMLVAIAATHPNRPGTPAQPRAGSLKTAIIALEHEIARYRATREPWHRALLPHYDADAISFDELLRLHAARRDRFLCNAERLARLRKSGASRGSRNHAGKGRLALRTPRASRPIKGGF